MSKKKVKKVALLLLFIFILNTLPISSLAEPIVGSIKSQCLTICVIANERTRNMLYEGNYYLIVKMGKANANTGTTEDYYQALKIIENIASSDETFLSFDAFAIYGQGSFVPIKSAD